MGGGLESRFGWCPRNQCLSSMSVSLLGSVERKNKINGVCWCVRVCMSSFLGLRSAFVALSAALLFL